LRLVLCKSCKINWDRYERKKLPLPPDIWIDRFIDMKGPVLLEYKKMARQIQHKLKLPYFLNIEEKRIIFRFEVMSDKEIRRLGKFKGPFTVGGNFISFWVEKI
jgi:hypothetical protein